MSAAVRGEQIRTLYRQSAPLLFANLANACVVVITLHHPRLERTLLAWLAAMALMTVLRLELLRRYLRKRPGAEEIERWGRFFVVGSACAGVLWGAAGALFFDPNDLFSKVLVPFVIGGMGAGAAATLSCHMPAFGAYFVPSIAPLTFCMFAVGDRVHLAMGVMLIVYALGLFAVARIMHRAIDEIRGAADRGTELVRQLLAFSRRERVKEQVIDVNECVVETERLFRRLIGEHVRVELELATSVLPVRGDPGQLQQVLINLVTNARDAMPDGGTLAIGTAARTLREHPALPDGEYVSLTVQDTGIGMGPDTVRHAFEPFFTTKEDRNGTGLGLSSVYAIVNRSGGHVAVESAPGKGSRFCIYLSALEVARAHAGVIDVLVTDVVMAKMGGPELARQLLEERPGLS
jgi:hypothetical protein